MLEWPLPRIDGYIVVVEVQTMRLTIQYLEYCPTISQFTMCVSPMVAKRDTLLTHTCCYYQLCTVESLQPHIVTGGILNYYCYYYYVTMHMDRCVDDICASSAQRNNRRHRTIPTKPQKNRKWNENCVWCNERRMWHIGTDLYRQTNTKNIENKLFVPFTRRKMGSRTHRTTNGTTPSAHIIIIWIIRNVCHSFRKRSQHRSRSLFLFLSPSFSIRNNEFVVVVVNNRMQRMQLWKLPLCFCNRKYYFDSFVSLPLSWFRHFDRKSFDSQGWFRWHI